MSSEECVNAYPHWTSNIRAEVVHIDVLPIKVDEVRRQMSNAAFSLISASGIELEWDYDGDANFFVFILNEPMFSSIEEANFEGFDKEWFSKTGKALYEQEACFALVYLNKDQTQRHDRIEAALVFVNAELSGKDLRACVFEEFANSLGLMADPIGQSSLFDEENFQISTDGIEYSLETTLMIEALYSIAGGEIENVAEFAQLTCAD